MTSKPIFSKRHYEAIADVLRKEKELLLDNVETFGSSQINPLLTEVSVIEESLIELFRSDNENFSAMRFENACTPRKEKD